MMMVFFILLGLMGITLVILLYSALIVSSEFDDAVDELEGWEDEDD